MRAGFNVFRGEELLENELRELKFLFSEKPELRGGQECMVPGIISRSIGKIKVIAQF